MWEKVRLFALCPKLSGLQLAKGPCFAHQAGTCNGACSHAENASDYNGRAQQAIDSFFENGSTVAIIGAGRSEMERSLVVVEKGNYLGFGYIGQEAAVEDLESARSFIKPSKDSRIVQNLINSFLQHPRGAELVELR
jgi:DNA polymerase-3 subunit epsilon